MNNLPDFTSYGYQVVKQLGDTEGSYISWKGIVNNSNTTVVIKQFCFATSDSNWSRYEAYQQEIELLKNLNHSGIPQYIASFETDNSFCFVRQYIEGTSLAKQTEVTAKELKIIAVKVLDILIYLQQQPVPIFNLGITPDNILLDKQLNVFLLDFSLANVANTEVNYASIKTSNAEFIAPEQLKSPCKASDLYSLGITLIKTIENQKSLALSPDKNSDNWSFQISPRVNTLDSGFQEWLNIMVEPQLISRYPDAETALKALQKSSWEEIDTTIKNHDRIALSNRAFTAGIATMLGLGIAIAIGFHLTQKVTEKSVVNLTIALMGMVIIYLTQSASATIITNDDSEKKQSILLAITVPLVLAIVTGIIFGRGEAVAMSLSAIIAQTATLSYVLLQKLPFNQKSHIFKATGLIFAIAFGLVCGLYLIG